MKNPLTAPLFLSLALLPILSPLANAATTSYNTGSLGTTGDGTNTDTVVLDQPGAVAAFGDYSSDYSENSRTTVPFLSQLNPAVSSAFTIEFWAKPATTDNDDACISNRYATGNRSGWIIYQRAAATGWNLRMYNGVGSGVAWELEGGTAPLNAWSHVVVVWNGTNPILYVNGAFITQTNKVGVTVSGNYNPNNSINNVLFSVGGLFDGLSPFHGLVDEVAFYPSALSAARILDHYNSASNATPGTYSSLVMADGAVEYLQQNPPFARISDSGANKVINFTGVLSQSTDLSPLSWTDLVVTSPYTVTPSVGAPKLFFRAHR